MNKHKLLAKIYNSNKNVSYSDFVTLIEAFGFRYTHTKGSHNYYTHKDIPNVVCIQSRKGEAKPYQIRQFMDLIKEHELRLEEQ
jgi:predicted RNA binding protein YcfA (HicA-like mRNA interferase family)